MSVEALPRASQAVAADVAVVVAQAGDEMTAGAPLTLPLALSVYMQRHDVDVAGLIEGMRLVRGAVLAVSGLDPRSEPSPLVSGDPRRAAVGLAEYLLGLLGRAARASAAAPMVVASDAAAQLI